MSLVTNHSHGAPVVPVGVGGGGRAGEVLEGEAGQQGLAVDAGHGVGHVVGVAVDVGGGQIEGGAAADHIDDDLLTVGHRLPRGEHVVRGGEAVEILDHRDLDQLEARAVHHGPLTVFGGLGASREANGGGHDRDHVGLHSLLPFAGQTICRSQGEGTSAPDRSPENECERM